MKYLKEGGFQHGNSDSKPFAQNHHKWFPPASCGSDAKYQAKRRPACNQGHGCQACRAKWLATHPDRPLEGQS